MRKYLVKVCVILSFVLMILTLGFASSNNTVYAKTYDKTPENCTHNRAQVKEITVSSSALQKEPGYTNDGVAKHSTGASVFYTKQSNVTAPGTSEVTIEVILDEAKTINVYYLFQRQRAQYCRAYVTITHDGVAGSEVEIVNQNWNIDTVECHAGTNTLKYKCRVTKGTWAGPGRRFYVIPDYVPSFDENDRCTQCGLQCDHKESSMHYDDNNHWYQCDDLCGKTFESTKHEHEYDEDNQCVVCGVVNMQKDANDYYLISNPAELATFTKYINVDGKTNIKGKLTADLNLKDVNFEPIGNSARVFVGEFDGGNHRIYNLNLIEENYSGAGLGFFGYVGSTSTGTAKISNLTIDKSCSFASNNVTAALVGYVKGTINIDHCGNEANVTSLNPSAVNSISAGLVAFGNEGIVNMTYCYNTGTIIGGSGYYGLAEDNAFYYGSAGLIGYVQAFNIDCSYNAGNVTTTICENDGQYNYVKESYHMTSFGNATGAAGAKVGENCYNYEAVNYGDGNGTVTRYSLITDSSILTALNANNQDGVKFVQDTDYPILAPRKEFVDSKHCKHDYEVSRYEWAEDYSKCKGIAACKNCGDTLVEEQNSTKTTINAPGELGLQMIYYTVVFENNTVFAPQKTLVEYKMAPTHKITLNANGGTGTPCAFYYEGFGTDLPYDYIKDGNYIEGWYLNADFTGEKVTKILATEKEDKVLYAKYEEHTCTLVDFDAVAPTCTTNGMTAGQRCSECGTIREGGEVILALGHDFVITADTASITARCSREGCNEVVTISLVRKDTGVEITNTEVWMAHGFLVPTVYYVGTGTTVYESTPIMPNVNGTYKATMTYEGKTAELEYLMKKQLDPTKKTDLDLPDHSPLYDDDEISVDTDIEDITIEWFYDDNGDGIPDFETPIGTGTTYIVKCPDENNPTHDDRGHKIIAKVTQNKKEDGTDYEDDKKPVQYSNPVLVYTPLNPNPENKPEIEVPGNKDEVEDGDVISADVDYTPITVKWYYDDDNDGTPDNPNNPIGLGQTYEIKVPDKEDETHNDKGHKIIGVITQDKKPDGTSYPEGEAPTVTTKPVQVAGKLPVEKAIKAGEFYFLGDTIIFSENVFVVGNPELIVAQKAGKVIVTYNIQYNTEVEFTDMLLGTDNIKRTIYADTLSPITSIADVLGLKCVSGDGTENNPYVFKAFTKGDYYVPLDPTKKTELDLPDHSPLYGDDEISVDTDATEVTVEWFYDDNGDGIPDSETPIGTGATYIVKCPDENDPTHDDRGHKIIAKVTQNKKEDGTDYEEGQKPVQYSNSVLVYTSFTPDPENKTEVEVPDNKPKAEDGDELSVDVTVKPVTVKWYYDDNDDGIPDDLDNPIGEGLTYTVKCPDTNNPNHDDTGHKIIAVITQDKKPDGTDYQEGDAPREITDPIIVKGNVGGFEELNQTTKPDINIPDDKEEADIEDELSVDTNAKPIEVKWYYDDNNDGKPDFSTPIGEGLTYQIISQDPDNPAHNDTGHKIIAVITQNKNEDGDYLPTSQIKTVTSNPIKVAGVIPHTHNFTYKANGTTITATCTNSYCIITEGLTLTLQAPEGDMVYDGNPRVATLAEGYSDIAFPNATIKYYSNNKEVTSCVDAGKYTAKVTFGNATVSVTFTIENWKEADEAHPEVKAEIVGAAEDENVHIKVEVKTTITAEATPADYDAVKAKLESDEQITTVYEVKLIRTINGADTVIQPSDLEDGATIIVTMDIPDGVKIGSFRILHIHGPNDSEFIDNFTVIGRTVQFKVSRLSEFAFVIKTTPSNHGFCGGWVLFIFVILQLLFLCFFCLLPLFNKKDKLVGKVDLFKLIGLGSSIVVLFIAVIVLALDACTVAVVSAILSALVCIAYIVFTIIDLVRIPVRN